MTTQTSRQSQRKVCRTGSAKAALPAQQRPETLTEPAGPKPAAGKSLRSQSPAPTQPVTVVEAKVDVGLGNLLFIRGQGDGLNWFTGVPLNCVDAATWVWSTRQAREKVVFKLLLNDQVWAKGEDIVVEAGRKIEIVPFF